MSLKQQLAAILLVIALLLAVGWAFNGLQYLAIGLSIICLGGATCLMTRKVLRDLTEVRATLSTMPTRLTQLTAAELHSMSTILRRYPECTLPTTSWSMRFTNLHTILNCLDSSRPHQIVEFGSGISTLMAAGWLREQGAGHLVSFDHDPGWAEFTRSALEREGLSEWADVRVVPLVETTAHGRQVTWYDLSVPAAELSGIEFVIVDGPPAGAPPKSLNRLAVLERLEDKLAQECCIVLDDAFRAGEREVVSLWLRRWPEFSLEMRGQTTGLAVLSRTGGKKESFLGQSADAESAHRESDCVRGVAQS